MGAMLDVEVIEDPAAAAVALDPVRSRLLTALAEPGSVEGLQVVVADIEEARSTLAAGGVEVSEVHDFPWGRFVYFADPDGNGWAVQEIVRPG